MKTRKMRRVKTRYQWDRMKVSFWFAPVVMSLAAILLAWAMYWVDDLIPNEILQDSRFFLSGTPDEIRAMLVAQASTILAGKALVHLSCVFEKHGIGEFCAYRNLAVLKDEVRHACPTTLRGYICSSEAQVAVFKCFGFPQAFHRIGKVSALKTL